jgi:hypothetical protein
VGTYSLFPEGKAPGSDGDHLPPFTADNQYAWSCTSTRPYYFTILVVFNQPRKKTLMEYSSRQSFVSSEFKEMTDK